MTQPEFDGFAETYDELLADPFRTRFARGGSSHFQARKVDLLLAYLHRRGIAPQGLDFLDVGCGRGELLQMLQSSFKTVSGCDPSLGMLVNGLSPLPSDRLRLQPHPTEIPFNDAQFDFVTAVCVYHHVPPEARAGLTAEIRRVLRPGGTAAIIEHNPYNPVTRLIVSRTPVDASAILLKPVEVRKMFRSQGLVPDEQRFFLYLPERIYKPGSSLEAALHGVPLGGQYAVFGKLGDLQSIKQLGAANA